jgi:hypothetical protein
MSNEEKPRQAKSTQTSDTETLGNPRYTVYDYRDGNRGRVIGVFKTEAEAENCAITYQDRVLVLDQKTGLDWERWAGR